MLSLNLDGKVVVVTGASGGLGTPVTKAFLDAGAKVVGVDRLPRSKSPDHPALTHVALAMEDHEAVQGLIDDVLAMHRRIDAVVHLVGGFAGGKRVEDTGEDLWEKMLAINLKPAIHLSRAVLPAMREARRGVFLAIGSPAAETARPGLSAYAGAKAALIAMVKTIAVENREFGIRANIISPGTLDTHANRVASPDADFTRWVQPASLASLLVWLVSDGAAEVSGSVLSLPGRE